MIYKKCHTSSRCETVLRYMFAAKIDDCDKRADITYLGGNVISASPFGAINSHGIISVDTRALEREFNGKMRLYKGPGEKLVEHHVLSLPSQDRLSQEQFSKAVSQFMKFIGVDRSMTWVAAKHDDTDCAHVHIALCRVQMKYNSDGTESHYGLLSDSNDYERGVQAARQIEQTFGLTEVLSPGENQNQKNQASIIRAISKSVLAQNPDTLTEFITLMASRGVEIKADTDKQGKARGIVYRLNSEDGRWISGSKIMSTKLTLGALKSILDYDPKRDDPTLGLGPHPAKPELALFERDARVQKIGVMVCANKINPEIAGLIKRHQVFHMIKIESRLYFGLQIECRFYPVKKIHQQKDKDTWEKITNTLFKMIMRMLREAFHDTKFGVFAWPEKCKPISSHAPSDIWTFDKLSEDNMNERINKTQARCKSPVIHDLTKVITSLIPESNLIPPASYSLDH